MAHWIKTEHDNYVNLDNYDSLEIIGLEGFIVTAVKHGAHEDAGKWPISQYEIRTFATYKEAQQFMKKILKETK